MLREFVAGDPVIRQATIRDLQAIVQLLADDELGRLRDSAGSPLDPRYTEAFAAITSDPNQRLTVLEDAGSVVGFLQISFVPGISHHGAWRGQIESVRIASARRGGGLGHKLLDWAVAECRSHACGMVQLTVDKSRPDALRFYRSLGFVASHEGLKLTLDL